MKLIFFGTSEFAVPALEMLFKNGYEISAVVTTPDEPAGRKQLLAPSPVKITAQKLNLNILQPQSLKIENLNLTENLDLGITASYGKIIPKEIINSFKFGILNIHPSLLPKYRGPSPIQTTLLNGDKETGVTLFLIDEKVDHGPIIADQKLKIMDQEKYEELHDRLSIIGAELMIKTLPDYISGKIQPTEQDHNSAIFTEIFKKEDGKINWSDSAENIFNKYRAFHIWPEIWTTWNNEMLKIKEIKLPQSFSDNMDPGQIYFDNGKYFVGCGSGRLELLKLQLEGSKEMPVENFVTGHRDFIGSILG
jgi:methionyl-tRNA formyltransferase